MSAFVVGVGRPPRHPNQAKGTTTLTNKNVAAVRLVERDEAADVVELPEELRVSLAEIAVVAREGLLALSASVGLVVMHEMMNAEMAAKVGSCEARQGGRPAGELAWRCARVGRVGRPARSGGAAAGPHDRQV